MRTVDSSPAPDPQDAADQTLAAHEHDGAGVEAFAERLDGRFGSASLARTIEIWDLSQVEAARLSV